MLFEQSTVPVSLRESLCINLLTSEEFHHIIPTLIDSTNLTKNTRRNKAKQPRQTTRITHNSMNLKKSWKVKIELQTLALYKRTFYNKRMTYDSIQDHIYLAFSRTKLRVKSFGEWLFYAVQNYLTPSRPIIVPSHKLSNKEHQSPSGQKIQIVQSNCAAHGGGLEASETQVMKCGIFKN